MAVEKISLRVLAGILNYSEDITPPLLKTTIKVWFVQVESNFELSGITVHATKYNNIDGAIDPETLSVVDDILLDPPTQNKYATLKEKYKNSPNPKINKSGNCYRNYS